MKKEVDKSGEEVVAKLCPVCGETSIEHIARDVLLAAYVLGLRSAAAGAIAYHCDRGHVFLLGLPGPIHHRTSTRRPMDGTRAEPEGSLHHE